ASTTSASSSTSTPAPSCARTTTTPATTPARSPRRRSPRSSRSAPTPASPTCRCPTRPRSTPTSRRCPSSARRRSSTSPPPPAPAGSDAVGAPGIAAYGPGTLDGTWHVYVGTMLFCDNLVTNVLFLGHPVNRTWKGQDGTGKLRPYETDLAYVCTNTKDAVPPVAAPGVAQDVDAKWF